MDTINFTNNRKNFPLSTQALDFMKLISQQAYKLAALGGLENYILSGCVNTMANYFEPGYVVIDGELLPFNGGIGSLTSNVHIIEINEAITAGYETYENVYVRRHVEFGSNVGGANTFVWNTFARVKTNLELEAISATKEELTDLSNLMMPKGGIIMWSGTTSSIPNGYALCDYNNGVPINGISIPDLRGRFIVGLDERINQSQATNVTNQTENYGVVNSRGGNSFVKLSLTEMPVHNHKILGNAGNDQSDTTGREMGISGADYGNITENAGGGQQHENRPPYYVLAFIIKVV